MDRGAWQATFHGVTQSDMTEQLSSLTQHSWLCLQSLVSTGCDSLNSDYRPSKNSKLWWRWSLLLVKFFKKKKKRRRRRKKRKKKLLTLFIVSRCHLRKISKIIAFHFQVEHLTFWLCSIGNKVFIQQLLKNDPHSVKNLEILLTRC